MSDSPHHDDILIVGAGPTGLTLAVMLRQQGVDVRLIDARDSASEHSKALAVQARTLELLEQLQVTERLLAEGVRVHALNLMAGGRRLARIDTTGIPSPYKFILTIPQSRTERILLDRLEELGGRVEWQTRLLGLEQDASGVCAQIETAGRSDSIRAHWLAGCDGAHSTVRESLKLQFRGERFPEWFVLADVQLDWDQPHDEVVACLSPFGALGIIPIPGESCYRLVAPLLEQDLSIRPDPDRQAFQRLFDERCPIRGRVHDPLWLSSFLIHRRMVSHYQVGRVLLAGDAAHVHSPVGGLGMNLGIHDALNLGAKLADVVKGRADVHQLRSYERERMPIARRILIGTRFATRVVTHAHTGGMGDAFLGWILNRRAIQRRIARAVGTVGSAGLQ